MSKRKQLKKTGKSSSGDHSDDLAELSDEPLVDSQSKPFRPSTSTQQQQQSTYSTSNYIACSSSSSGSESVFLAFILLCICILAFMCRLFSVLRYESVIHEFDPWFNFRTTKFLVEQGFYEFHNWFDNATWYPLGRFIGGTIYPGLMWTAAVLYHLLHQLHFTMDIRNVCVLLAPFMAAATSVATYLLTKECWNASAGIYAAAFVAIAPGYISRSVAGSYDNEAVAIFALVFTFYVWVKAVKSGSMAWGAAAALAYFYMVSAWGGYIFIINLIPSHVLILLLCGRYTHRLYVAYCSFYVLATLLSMQILFVGFQPVSSPEHLLSFAVFGLLQLYNAYYWLQSMMSEREFRILGHWCLIAAVSSVILLLLLALSGTVPFLTGRLYSLLGATTNIAIVKSVSEHQPSPWTTFFFDLHCVIFLVPVGLYYSFLELNDANVFAIIYVLFASYFASIMVRLVLVLTPGACVLAGIGASVTMQNYFDVVTSPSESVLIQRARIAEAAKNLVNNASSNLTAATLQITSTTASIRVPRVSKAAAWLVIFCFLVLCFFFTIHCNWVTSSAYSSPSIVLQAHAGDGSLIIFDDFREAYSWLRHNTASDAKILSWWDYGYQITGMGNRTVIVDNNTRNNTHIATVGLVMASNEERAYPVIRSLDVDYLLVIFGGKIGYSSDDINKFLWMVRISGGIFPEVVESEYFNTMGQYRIDSTISKRMSESLMYKMCFFDFDKVQTHYGRPAGFDLVRGSEMGVKNIEFDYLEEAFTSEHWMVRIYRVLKEEERPGLLERIERKKMGF